MRTRLLVLKIYMKVMMSLTIIQKQKHLTEKKLIGICFMKSIGTISWTVNFLNILFGIQ